MYDKSERIITYSFTGINLSSSDATKVVRLPSGMKGYLKDVRAGCTTTSAGATTTPKVQVGKNGTLTESLNWDLGALTAPAGRVASAQTGANKIQKNTDGTPIEMAADTDIYFTFKAATGAGAAGVFDFHIDIVVY